MSFMGLPKNGGCMYALKNPITWEIYGKMMRNDDKP
jgi:hypothetical protein